MSRFERIMKSYVSGDSSINNSKPYHLRSNTFTRGVQMLPFIKHANANIVQDQGPTIHHTGAKYGATKYISSLHVGKMHKLL